MVTVIPVFWNAMLFTFMDIHQRLEGTFYLHLQSRKVSREGKGQEHRTPSSLD
jgi:hypothetical protein